MKHLQKLFDWKKYRQRFILALTLVILLASAIALPASATGIYQIPKLNPGGSPWVIDQSEVLSRINESAISSNLEKRNWRRYSKRSSYLRFGAVNGTTSRAFKVFPIC